MENELKVYAALYEEANEGWIWISDSWGIQSREHVKITCNSKNVYCSIRTIDRNFLRKYNDNPRCTIAQTEIDKVIIISDYFRKKLRITGTQKKCSFRIKSKKWWNFWYPICAILQHPNVTAKTAGWLAVISIVLSIVSICPKFFIAILTYLRIPFKFLIEYLQCN